MARHLVIASGAGDGRFADDAALVGAVRLLRRRARLEVRVTSHVPESAARYHPEIPVIALDDLSDTLVDCELVCVVGLLDDALTIERAALHVAAAKLRGIPSALLAARVVPPADAASRAFLHDIVAQVEAISAADATSAAHFAAWRGRRVEVACPLELLVAPDTAGRDPGTVAIDATLFDRATQDVRAHIATALVAAGFHTAVVLGSPTVPFPDASLDWQPCRGWPEVRGALARATLALGPADAGVHALALGSGIPSVALVADGEASSMHTRLGLGELVHPLRGSGAELGAVLTRARTCDGQALAHRTAPLRALAHRALGALADAGRVQPLDPGAWSRASRRLVARAAALLVAPALARGDAPSALAVLDPWRSTLATEPPWAIAHARASALLGCDADACMTLEAALADHPDDPACLAALARGRTRRGDPAGATAVWRTLARLAPTDANPHAELGSLALIAGRVDVALDHWASALRRDPEHPCARSAQACLEADPRAMVRFWTALTEVRADVAFFWYQLGLAAERSDDWQAAEARFQRAADLAPDAVSFLEALGRAVARRDAARARPILARAQALAAHAPAVADSPPAGV